MVDDSSAAELHTPPPKVRIRLSTLALKPRGDVTRSPKRSIKELRGWALITGN